MNTRFVMMSSAIMMAICGMACIFTPDELCAYFTVLFSNTGRLVIQIVGAFYFAFAMLNWMAKGTFLGGVYGRPIVMANLTHVIIAGLSLGKQAVAGHSVALWVMSAFYIIFVILFGVILFTSPKANA